MKGVIIKNAYADIKGIVYQTERLKSELEKLGAEVEILTPADISYFIEDGRIVFDVQVDFIVFLDKDAYLSKMIDKSGIRTFNCASAIELCDDKMLTYIALSNNGLQMPKTIPSMLCYSDNAEVSSAFLKRVEAELSYPLICKNSFGSLGKGVYLINSYEELKEIEEKLKFYPHLYQKYVSAHKGTDIRIIVVGGKFVAAMKRSNENDYRSNIECGGNGERIAPPKSFIEAAESAAKILKLDYCGVDLLIDENDDPVLCEVNSNAFFTGIEACTGVDVAKIYAEHIIKNINN